MTSEIVLNGEQAEATPAEPTTPFEIVQDTLEGFFGAADVTAVYDEPVVSGDHIVIPAAEVVGTLGFGVGGDDERNGGGGGGGSVIARPVAAIVITPHGVRVEPIVDVTKLALAALTAAGFMLGMFARMSRKRAPHFDQE